jgi:hypothetical protein
MARTIYVSGKKLNVTRGDTTFIQTPQGLMMGRKVPSDNQKSDTTRNLRAGQDIEIDGKPGIGSNDIHNGQIMGRLKKGESKPKSVGVSKHYRKGKFIGYHIRKIH